MSVGQGISVAVSGSTCRAANLNQALQGIGTDQSGIKNNATNSFFVVCPLTLENTGSDEDYTNAQIEVLFPSGGGEMTCVFRFEFVGGSFQSFSMPMMSTNQRHVAIAGPPLPPAVDVSATPNGTVVCPLDPGEGIAWIFVF